MKAPIGYRETTDLFPSAGRSVGPSRAPVRSHPPDRSAVPARVRKRAGSRRDPLRPANSHPGGAHARARVGGAFHRGRRVQRIERLLGRPGVAGVVVPREDGPADREGEPRAGRAGPPAEPRQRVDSPPRSVTFGNIFLPRSWSPTSARRFFKPLPFCTFAARSPPRHIVRTFTPQCLKSASSRSREGRIRRRRWRSPPAATRPPRRFSSSSPSTGRRRSRPCATPADPSSGRSGPVVATRTSPRSRTRSSRPTQIVWTVGPGQRSAALTKLEEVRRRANLLVLELERGPQADRASAGSSAV